MAAEPALGALIDGLLGADQEMRDTRWGLLMALVPLIAVVGFAVLFWAARGVKALTFLLRYQPRQVAALASAPTAVLAAPAR